MNRYIFKSNGNYLGFLQDDNIFSRDGIYLGWLDGDGTYAWDSSGKFRGYLIDVSGNNFIILNQLQIPPIPRMPRPAPLTPILPPPPVNVSPIPLPVGYIDGFRFF